MDPQLAQRCIDTIRTLSADAVQKANSGHPGTPIALAPAAFVLWTKHLRYDAAHPDWPDRDRFVLSCGHASMLLYSMLHLTGYDLPLAEIERFRQWDSKTPGHPEYGHTPGVETTTGPLGQGMANAVGMAIAEELLAHEFNTDPNAIVDHRTFVFASDGDMMEGISHEAASLAGHLQLGKLTVLYDDNHITIDGVTELAYPITAHSDSKRMDGTSRRSRTATISRRSTPRSPPQSRRPVVRRSSCAEPTSATDCRPNRTPRPRTERRSVPTRSRPGRNRSAGRRSRS